MNPRRAAFAVPGDLTTLTGGYIFDRKLLASLRALDRDVTHIALGASFPDPTRADMQDAARRLAAVPEDCPVIIDGLAMGAMDHEVLTGMSAPIVALVHHPLALESGLSAERRDHLHRTELRNLGQAAHIVVPSPHIGSLLVSDYGVAQDRITIARPGSDPRSGQSGKSDPPLILSVGIQMPRKGHDVLLRALARVSDRSWQAVVAGAPLDTAHAGMLARLVGDLGLADRVTLAGQVPGVELTRLYERAHLFALATRYEGHGIVFDEAMAHGLPIVTCAVGAVPDTVAPGAGVLVPPDDPDAFAEALASVLDDPKRHGDMAAASIAAGETLPDWATTAQVVDDVLSRVATGALTP
ncbi:glycosyltransferase involved in cell wall biosynthesis [Palleronia aestuarii]|uniref:Glycosyltransferase involved in cell wall biosynthesis n=1 Tax=Palleronia aestuarii TaxID=568105 RepID=A0A2W7NCW5_9RHOB|nr:glycosyltransferase family 4 protein [Palleronia aestuarii]PZX18215.1 glycosyltransferase involved in cell wall biosynthesis [Palleronia aestuarii]